MKTNSKKYTLPLIALLGLVLLGACQKNWLERTPLGRFTEDDITTGSLEGRVFAAYAGLRHEGISAMPFIAIHNIRSDDADKGSLPSDGADAEAIFDNFQYSTDFWLINNYWTGHYNLINLTNNVFHEADSIGIVDEATQINVAEASLLRAYAYFNLVRTFGEVPIINFRITDPSEGYRPKSTVSEIYDFLDDDLDLAIAHLPTEKDWGGQFPGRLTRWTALAIKTKALMARQQWASALSSAEQIMASGEFDLSTRYDELFTEARENSLESIFEIQAYYAPNITNLGINYALHQGVRGNGAWDLGWGWNVPNERLVNAFEDGDPRQAATILYSGTINQPGGIELPAGLPRPYWNRKAHTSQSLRREYGSQFGYWFNLRLIRYADIVLLAAEAANEIGETDKALEYLEQVRSRARGGSSSILPEVTVTEQVAVRNRIRQERQVELGMEGERFFDLVRWDIDVQTFQNAGKTSYQVRHRYLPIPQVEIDRSGNILVQNPHY